MTEGSTEITHTDGPQPGHAGSVAIVVACAEGSADPRAALDAIAATTGATAGDPRVEVVVVSSAPAAAEELDGLDVAVRVVRVEAPTNFAAAANRGVGSTSASTVCVLPAEVVVQGDWLPRLLAALGPGVGAAAPQVRDGAGALLAVPTLSALARVDDDGHDGRGPVFGALVVRRVAFDAVGGFDATQPESAAAGFELALALREAGWNTAYEPRSIVVHHGAGGAPLPATTSGQARPLSPSSPWSRFDEVLVIHDRNPSAAGQLPDLRITGLVEEMRSLWPSTGITVLGADGHGSSRRVRRPVAPGVDVVTGPRDWPRWFAQRAGRYSHVVVTSCQVARRFDRLLARTQPQAMRILCQDVLDFRHPSAMEPLQPSGEELPGLRKLTAVMRERTTETILASDAVWCCSDDDRRFVATVAPGIPCTVLPMVTGHMSGAGFDQRSGLVALGLPEFDASAAHEDALVGAAGLLPLITGRGREVRLGLIVGEPSPRIQRLADRDGVILDGDTRAVGEARVLLAPYFRGSGGRWAVALAVASATPFVATPLAAQGMELGSLGELLVSDDLSGLAQRAWDLHEDEELWQAVHVRLSELASTAQSRSALRRSLMAAGGQVGLAGPAGHGARRAAPSAATSTSAGHHVSFDPGRPRFVPMPQVPPLGPNREEAEELEGLPPDAQYDLWVRLHGPTAQRLASVAFELKSLAARPKLSVVMPVYDTDPEVLSAAVDSVRNQVYENWELCIADDASTKAETRAVLDGLLEEGAADPRIKVAFLDHNEGIAAATNAALALATGELVGFLDHDDELKPQALARVVLRLAEEPELDVLYSDWDMRDPDGTLVQPYFKPGWSPDYLMCRNYICHFLVVRNSLLVELGGLRTTFDGSQDYDLALRLMERTEEFGHIAEPLYTWRKVEGSVADQPDAKPYAFDSAKRALADALRRRGTPGEVCDGLVPSAYRVRYDIVGRPRVSIIIPTRDRFELLENCIRSVLERSTYDNYEIMVVDNQSGDPRTLEYLASYPGRVIRYDHPFNYARMMNLAAAEADGDLLLFLNNDTEVINKGWIEALVEHGQRPEVGAVGARLIYPSGRVQHEGVALGILGGVAANMVHDGLFAYGELTRNCSAVTGACMLLRPSVFWEVGGNDERLRVAYNDVDLGLRIRQAGYQIVYTPHARLYHHESASRQGAEPPDDEVFFRERWRPYEFRDQFYNSNLDPYKPFDLRL